MGLLGPRGPIGDASVPDVPSVPFGAHVRGTSFPRAVARTAGPNQVIVHQALPSVGDTYWVQRTVNPTPQSGTSVTINDTAPTGDRYNLSICEIRSPQ